MPASSTPHILNPFDALSDPFRSPKKGRGGRRADDSDHATRDRVLVTNLETVFGRQSPQPDGNETSEPRGSYVEVVSRPGESLKLDALDNRTKKIRLLGHRREKTTEESQSSNAVYTEHATIFVPDQAKSHFKQVFDDYSQGPRGNSPSPPNSALAGSIAEFRATDLQSFWTESFASFPSDEIDRWWEVWLQRDAPQMRTLLEELSAQDIEVSSDRLHLDDRTILLIRGTASRLSDALIRSSVLTEIRLAKSSSTFLAYLPISEQA